MRKLLIGFVALWMTGSLAAVVLAPVFFTLLVLVGVGVGMVAYRRGRSAAAHRPSSAPQRGHFAAPPQQFAPGMVVQTTTVVYQQVLYPPAPSQPDWNAGVRPTSAAPAAVGASEAQAELVPDHVPAAWEELHREGRQ
ncbi:hypothetical protein [Tsukamurella ocularis]|uniref:hypothetical protein n=1 Tax=Tsukamurella ocularis TaxID=1970234 RepID=UPI002167A9B3|nr:hypothetical protein [Tsukamurella ocularis]MCS3853336.1 hypothetical protein [Tsukamurella ocularis]